MLFGTPHTISRVSRPRRGESCASALEATGLGIRVQQFHPVVEILWMACSAERGAMVL